MDNSIFISYPIEERSYLSFIKREIHNAIKHGFNETKTAEIDIIVSELTSNIIKHAIKGELLYKFQKTETGATFEVICIDHGPGIKDVPLAMQDGVSTTNTLGQGLGASERLSTLFQLYSQPGWGTIAYSKVSTTPFAEADRRVISRALLVCKPGETLCGDGCGMRSDTERSYVFLGDGLGHGEHAHDASKKGVEYFLHTKEKDPVEIIRSMHVELKKTRGLVGTIAVLNHSSKQWQLFGIGNISTRINQGMSVKNYTPYNGIVGMNMPNTTNYSEIELEKYQYLIMCSDGIKTKWDMSKYPYILKHDPIILAAAIYKDHARRTDDMSVLVVKVV
ncbi:MAG: anti-sigma regulatory factor (Ser/Thr protein kinase) [Cytophagaceae bacterium]|jgi:anti-sigma regulatory factor (Ser/Thr protein kinase)|nr:anti-sigma regulatory factor (Ser/Thr protein kinase) [Cytophagaceae bacterium]